jgi:hypothetical protein
MWTYFGVERCTTIIVSKYTAVAPLSAISADLVTPLPHKFTMAYNKYVKILRNSIAYFTFSFRQDQYTRHHYPSLGQVTTAPLYYI